MLTFNLKKEWFDKIKSGEKTHEYRKYNKYWTKRLNHIKTPCECIFACGYPKKDDNLRRLKAIITDISLLNNGINTDLRVHEFVWDIEFRLIGDQECI